MGAGSEIIPKNNVGVNNSSRQTHIFPPLSAHYDLFIEICGKSTQTFEIPVFIDQNIDGLAEIIKKLSDFRLKKFSFWYAGLLPLLGCRFNYFLLCDFIG